MLKNMSKSNIWPILPSFWEPCCAKSALYTWSFITSVKISAAFSRCHFNQGNSKPTFGFLNSLLCECLAILMQVFVQFSGHFRLISMYSLPSFNLELSKNWQKLTKVDRKWQKSTKINKNWPIILISSVHSWSIFAFLM